MIFPMDQIPEIDVFHGQLSPNAARVYARVTSVPGGGEWRMAGRVRGPECRFGRTLLTECRLQDLGAGPTLLASATVADPCPWTADLPAFYRIVVELMYQGRVVTTAEQIIGLRGLGAGGRNLYWAGKRWVLRGVRRRSVTPASIAAWREESTAMLLEELDESVCEQASNEGVVVVARVSGTPAQVPGLLRKAARWPAVVLVVLSPHELSQHENMGPGLRDVAPNLLLAHEGLNGSGERPPWAHAWVASFSQLTEFAREKGPPAVSCPMPVVAMRLLDGQWSLGNARSACDALQRDLAMIGDFSGYLV